MENVFDQYKRLLAIADAGLHYGNDVFDKERYKELREVALELLSNYTEEPLAKLQYVLDDTEGYPTPKVDVRAFIQKDGRFLLVEDAATKEWSLPGGYAEVGFSPKENIRKEVLEETGLEVEKCELVAVFDTDLRSDIPQLFQYYKLIFACTVGEGEFMSNIETTNRKYFALDNLPSLSLKRTTKEQLEILLQETNYCD